MRSARFFHSKRLHSYGWLLLNTLIWGAALGVVKPALDYTTPFRYLGYRYFLALLFSLPILWNFRKELKQHGSSLVPKVVGLELIGTTAALSLLYIGLKYTTSIEANMLAATQPVFITIGSILLLKENQERHEWLGLIISLFGSIILTIAPGNGLSASGATMLGLSNFAIVGALLVICFNLLYAVYFPLAKKAYKKTPKFLVTSLSYCVGLVSFGTLALGEVSWSFSRLSEVVIADMTHQSVWFAALYMALFGSIIGLTAYLKGQDGIEASEATLFFYLQPLIAIPLGMFMLGEKVTVFQIIGMVVVVVGVWIAERRVRYKS